MGTLTSNIDLDDRKNLKNTIKWLCEEFKEDEDVGIILKTSFGLLFNNKLAPCEDLQTLPPALILGPSI